MANGRLRIGHASPGSRVLLAEYGQYSLTGNIAQLLYNPVSGAEYDWADAPAGYTDLWVDPQKATNGDGSVGNPYQFSQVMSHPSPAAKRFICLPGRLSVTAVDAGDSKMPALRPSVSGTQAQPAILKAQFPATRSTTTPEQMTIIERTANAGSIFGSTGADYWRFDGFKFEGTHGGGGNENAHIVLRSCTGWWVTRTWIDDQFESFVPHIPCPGVGCNDGSTNGGGFFLQGIDFSVFRDVLIENVGQEIGTNLLIWQGFEMYDVQDTEFSYFTIRNIWGIGVHMKGNPEREFLRNRVHHAVVDSCADSGCNPYQVRASTQANYNYWWNIVVSNCGKHGSEFTSTMPDGHYGTQFQNMTYVNNGFSNIMFRNNNYLGDHVGIRNSVFSGTGKHIEFLDQLYPGTPTFGGVGNEDIAWDYNRYNNTTAIAQSGSGTDANIAAWRSRTDAAHPPGWDDNSDTTAHTYVNFAAGDYHTNSSVAADRPDHWGRYGGGNVRPGAWETGGYRNNV